MTKTDRKAKAKNRVEKLLSLHANEDFFRKHFVTLSNTVQIYYTLKLAFKDTARLLKYYEGFEKEFSRFYGIQRFVDDDFCKKYYSVMDELREKTEYNERELCEKLMDGDKIQFSFTTKMLNIMNDAKYPIYDSYIAKAFGIDPLALKNHNKMDNYLTCYQIITDTYNELLPKCKDIFASFRNVIKIDEVKMPDMRVLDIIVWKLGKEIINKNIEP